MNQGPRWILMMKKTRAVKSRATVPLNLDLFLTRNSVPLQWSPASLHPAPAPFPLLSHPPGVNGGRDWLGLLGVGCPAPDVSPDSGVSGGVASLAGEQLFNHFALPEEPPYTARPLVGNLVIDEACVSVGVCASLGACASTTANHYNS
jgi:hypothetical protein